MLSESNARTEMELAANSIGKCDCEFVGRGIVIPGGGTRLFTCAWVNARMLRHVGCTLPIELWHLGEEEMNDEMRSLIEPYGVTCVNALRVREDRPARILNGWELKPYSLVNSRFSEVILLDADNVPLVDPAFLFEEPQYRDYGAVFWPDRWRLRASEKIWSLTGVAHRDEPEFETGQIALDKRRVWRPLLLTMWMNDHSDFWYRYIHGDKETFHFAWRKLGVEYGMPAKPLVELPGVFCQHDFEGRRIFQHRYDAEWTMDKDDQRIPGFINEETALAFLDELREKWSQIRPQRFDRGVADRTALRFAGAICDRPWEWWREGRSEGKVQFRLDGRVLTSCAEIPAQVWGIRASKAKTTLSVWEGEKQSCVFHRQTDGTWYGKSLRGIRPTVKLTRKDGAHPE